MPGGPELGSDQASAGFGINLAFLFFAVVFLTHAGSARRCSPTQRTRRRMSIRFCVTIHIDWLMFSNLNGNDQTLLERCPGPV